MPNASSSRVAIVVRMPGGPAPRAGSTLESGLSGKYTTWRQLSAATPRQTACAHAGAAGVTSRPEGALCVLDADIFGLCIAGQRLETLLAPVSTLLVSAEWQFHTAARSIGVHIYLAALDARRERERLVDVARPHAGDESVHAVVGDGGRFVQVIERDDRKHRTEDLFLRHPHAEIGRA